MNKWKIWSLNTGPYILQYLYQVSLAHRDSKLIMLTIKINTSFPKYMIFSKSQKLTIVFTILSFKRELIVLSTCYLLPIEEKNV